VKLIYLDSSAIVKRYIYEIGSDTIDLLFEACEIGKIRIFFSIWNIGEVIGTLDKHKNRNNITEKEFKESLKKFLLEIQKLYRLKTLKICPTNTELFIEIFPYIPKFRIYEADALQIITSKKHNCDIFISADKYLVEIMKKFNKNSFNIETDEKEISNITFN